MVLVKLVAIELDVSLAPKLALSAWPFTVMVTVPVSNVVLWRGVHDSSPVYGSMVQGGPYVVVVVDFSLPLMVTLPLPEAAA
jgi:hypothetical protein